jgi:preprotein translocase subunit SecA
VDVVEILTNRPMARQDKEDFIYKTTRENSTQL